MIPPILCKRETMYLPEACTECETLEARVDELESGKQDKLIAGSNIIINGNVISATGEGGGGDIVTWTPLVWYGTALGTLSINGVNYNIYAPEAAEYEFGSLAVSASTTYQYRIEDVELADTATDIQISRARFYYVNSSGYIQPSSNWYALKVARTRISYYVTFPATVNIGESLRAVTPFGVEGTWSVSH